IVVPLRPGAALITLLALLKFHASDHIRVEPSRRRRPAIRSAAGGAGCCRAPCRQLDGEVMLGGFRNDDEHIAARARRPACLLAGTVRTRQRDALAVDHDRRHRALQSTKLQPISALGNAPIVPVFALGPNLETCPVAALSKSQMRALKLAFLIVCVDSIVFIEREGARS